MELFPGVTYYPKEPILWKYGMAIRDPSKSSYGVYFIRIMREAGKLSSVHIEKSSEYYISFKMT